MATSSRSIIQTTVESPLGDLLLVGDEDRLRAVRFRGDGRPLRIESESRRADQPFAEACDQLGQYFAGERRSFELALARAGTPFQRRIWDALERIPYGATASYGGLAESIGAPSAARAVGTANARNPLAIVVPCHRVIGAGGGLTGYAGGIERKRLLLELESSSAAGAGSNAALTRPVGR
jgi:methylated-DNA-[protein]-cysteine S-methyltransferase